MAARRAHGIDISVWQSDFKMSLVTANDLDFVIMKSSQATFEDKAFAKLTAETANVAIRGAYHYYVPRKYLTSRIDTSSATKRKAKRNKEKQTSVYMGGVKQVYPSQIVESTHSGPNWKDQADHFIRTVSGKGLSFYALDIEAGPNNRYFIGTDRNVFSAADLADIKQWMDYVEENTGKPVVLYTSPNVYVNLLMPFDRTRSLPRMKLWLAAYGLQGDRDKSNPLQILDTGRLKMKRPEENWHFWQYSADKNEQGVNYGLPPDHMGNSRGIDLNVYNGTIDDLRAWLGLETGARGGLVQDEDEADDQNLVGRVRGADTATDSEDETDEEAEEEITEPYPGLTNQNMIDSFFSISATNYWDMIQRAQLTAMAASELARREIYSGPAVAELPGLNQAEKTKLLQALVARGFTAAEDDSLRTEVAAPPYPELTNQNMIDLFFASATPSTYWDWIVQADLDDLAANPATRKKIYTGPKIEDLPGLSRTQKKALLKNLPG